MVEPKRVEDIGLIDSYILGEIEQLKEKGISEGELTRAIKKTEMSIHSLMESIEHQAYEIGKYYWQRETKIIFSTYLDQPKDQLKKDIQDILATYFRPTVMHKGSILPLPEKEKHAWTLLQEASDQEDQRILSARERAEPIEAPRHAATVAVKIHSHFRIKTNDIYA